MHKKRGIRGWKVDITIVRRKIQRERHYARKNRQRRASGERQSSVKGSVNFLHGSLCHGLEARRFCRVDA